MYVYRYRSLWHFQLCIQDSSNDSLVLKRLLYCIIHQSSHKLVVFIRTTVAIWWRLQWSPRQHVQRLFLRKCRVHALWDMNVPSIPSLITEMTYKMAYSYPAGQAGHGRGPWIMGDGSLWHNGNYASGHNNHDATWHDVTWHGGRWLWSQPCISLSHTNTGNDVKTWVLKLNPPAILKTRVPTCSMIQY